MKKLRWLELQYNSIESIEDGTFANFTELELLDLSENKLKSINETTLIGLNTLKYLSLDENNINFIHKNAFNNLENLKLLELHSNAITQFEFGTFACLTSLERLYLSHNFLQTFNFELISSMRQTLRTLYIHDNKLNELKISKDLYFSVLTWLRISENQFDCCKLQRFFNSNEGKALTKNIEDCIDKVVCDDDRKVDKNGQIPNLICETNLFDSSIE